MLAASAILVTHAPAQQTGQGEDALRAGKLAYNGSCRTCHSIREGDNRLGPNLHDIIGREAGTAEYRYSPAMANSSIVWDEATLDRFIQDPEAVVPGNNMKPYGGISDAEVRESIVKWLAGQGAAQDN